MTQTSSRANLTGEQIEEIKQKASESFWPHARPTKNMFN